MQKSGKKLLDEATEKKTFKDGHLNPSIDSVHILFEIQNHNPVLQLTSDFTTSNQNKTQH